MIGFDDLSEAMQVRSVNTQPAETLVITLADAEHRVAGEELIELSTVGSCKC